MSERQKEIIAAVGEALPAMSEFKQGYLLGLVEGNMEEKQEITECIRELQEA